MSDLKRHEVLVKCQEMSAGPLTKESHANMNATFNIPSTIILGGGTSDQLVAQVQRLGARRALLVTDAYLQQNGLAKHFAGQLRAASVETAVFVGVQPDPTSQNVMDGLGELQRCRAEVVIGLGGGSPMDAAKTIAVLATNPPPIAQYAGYHKVTQPGLPLVVIPTTAGTGSEVTKVAVITDSERNVEDDAAQRPPAAARGPGGL